MKRIIVELDNYIEAICESTPHELSGSFEDQDGKKQYINVLNNSMFTEYFEERFYNYNMTLKDTEDIEAGIVEKFNKLWTIFQIENKENIDKLCAAYYWDYVPVYNYDRTETWTDVRTGSEDINKDMIYAEHTDENGTQGTINDTTTNGATTRTDKTATMDTNQFQNEAQSVVDQVINTNARTFNNYKETYKNAAHTDKDNTEHVYNEVTDTHSARLFGNIGVTTNMDMIAQEFEGRVHMLGYEFMKRFFDKFAFML